MTNMVESCVRVWGSSTKPLFGESFGTQKGNMRAHGIGLGLEGVGVEGGNGIVDVQLTQPLEVVVHGWG